MAGWRGLQHEEHGPSGDGRERPTCLFDQRVQPVDSALGSAREEVCSRVEGGCVGAGQGPILLLPQCVDGRRQVEPLQLRKQGLAIPVYAYYRQYRVVVLDLPQKKLFEGQTL